MRGYLSTWAGANCPVNPALNVTTNSSGGIATASFVSGSCAFTSWPTTSNWTTGGGLSAGTGATFTWASIYGSTNDRNFRLHPTFVPYGCTVSSVLYPYCIYWASEVGSAYNAWMAYSATIDGNYTIYGCGPPPATSCATPTVLPTSAINYPQQPTAINVGGAGGVNYTYFSTSAANSYYWNSPAGDGITFIFGGQAYQGSLGSSGSYTGDWDAGLGPYDNMVVLNKCGFYEYYYTSYNGTNWQGTRAKQIIWLLVSNSPAGPWWKMPGPVFQPTSTLYEGTPFLGDSQPIFINGRFLWIGNYDDGTHLSWAVGASMTDACATMQ
jgi:hypothetical protein